MHWTIQTNTVSCLEVPRFKCNMIWKIDNKTHNIFQLWNMCGNSVIMRLLVLLCLQIPTSLLTATTTRATRGTNHNINKYNTRYMHPDTNTAAGGQALNSHLPKARAYTQFHARKGLIHELMQNRFLHNYAIYCIIWQVLIHICVPTMLDDHDNDIEQNPRNHTRTTPPWTRQYE